MSWKQTIARWLGIAPLDLADPDELLDLGLEGSDLESIERRDIASDLLEPEQLLDLAAGGIGPEEMLGIAIQRIPAEPEEVASALNAAAISDEAVIEIMDRRDLWPSPIERVAHLPDDPHACYVWILGDDATEEDRISLANEFEDAYIRENHNEPQSLHLIVRNVEQIKELSADEVRQHIKPWLKGAEEN